MNTPAQHPAQPPDRQADYWPDPNAPRKKIARTDSARPLDPQWHELHALLKAYLAEHAANQGKVRPELRQALFEAFNARLTELTRIVAMRFHRKDITEISQAVGLRVWNRHASFTSMMLKYDSNDAKRGFNWFYGMVLNCMRDARKPKQRGVDMVSVSQLGAESIEDEAFHVLLDQLGGLDDGALSIEHTVELHRGLERLLQLPPELRRIAEHIYVHSDDQTQADFAQSSGISLATYKRRKSEIEAYLHGQITLEEMQQ